MVVETFGAGHCRDRRGALSTKLLLFLPFLSSTLGTVCDRIGNMPYVLTKDCSCRSESSVSTIYKQQAL